MIISILPEAKKITIDDLCLVCDYSMPTVEYAFYDSAINHGKIVYNDGTPNQILTEVPGLSYLLLAFWTAYAVKFLPSAYHTFNTTTKLFEITSENQALLDAEVAEQEAAQAVIDAEIAANAMANITYTEAEAWIEATVIDLPTAKEAMKQLVKLIIART